MINFIETECIGFFPDINVANKLDDCVGTIVCFMGNIKAIIFH